MQVESRSRSDRVKLVHITTVPVSLRFVSGQVGYMKARGFAIHAISSPGEELDAFGGREEIPVYAVDLPRRITPVRDLGAVWRIYRRLRQIGPQVVHSHTPKGGLLGMIAASLARVPVRVYHMRGLLVPTATGPKRALLRAVERTACALADQVICVSHSVRDVAVAERLCPPDKIKVLLGGSGNGVDAAGRFNPHRLTPDVRLRTRLAHGIPPDALVAGFIGRIVRDKGVAEMVDAWRTLRAEFPNLHLLVIGPFEPQDPVSPAVEGTLRTDPRVHLVGVEWDTPPLYAAMDVVLLPTYREGFPNVPLEAASMELPVVATRIPGCVDAVEEGVTGVLVPPRNGAALEAAVRGYLQNSDLRRRHGLAGRERALKKFRQEAIWEAIYQEYLQLLTSRGFPVDSVFRTKLERTTDQSSFRGPNADQC